MDIIKVGTIVTNVPNTARDVTEVTVAVFVSKDTMEHIVNTDAHQAAEIGHVTKTMDTVSKDALISTIWTETSVMSAPTDVPLVTIQARVKPARLGIGVRSVKMIALSHATGVQRMDNVRKILTAGLAIAIQIIARVPAVLNATTVTICQVLLVTGVNHTAQSVLDSTRVPSVNTGDMGTNVKIDVKQAVVLTAWRHTNARYVTLDGTVHTAKILLHSDALIFSVTKTREPAR